MVSPPTDDEELNVEVLFDDYLVVAASPNSRWARRARVDLAELVDEPWILTPPDNWPNVYMAEAFRARGLAMPKIMLTTFSIPLRANLVATGPYISAFQMSVVLQNAEQFPLKVLPIDLPPRRWALALVTMKNRTLSQVAQRFIEHIRAFTRAMDAPALRKKSA